LDTRVSPEWLGQYNKAPVYLSSEEVTVHVCRKVLMEVDIYFAKVVDPQGILDQQLSPHRIHLLNVTVTIMNYIISLY